MVGMIAAHAGMSERYILLEPKVVPSTPPPLLGHFTRLLIAEFAEGGRGPRPALASAPFARAI